MLILNLKNSCLSAQHVGRLQSHILAGWWSPGHCQQKLKDPCKIRTKTTTSYAMHNWKAHLHRSMECGTDHNRVAPTQSILWATALVCKCEDSGIKTAIPDGSFGSAVAHNLEMTFHFIKLRYICGILHRGGGGGSLRFLSLALA